MKKLSPTLHALVLIAVNHTRGDYLYASWKQEEELEAAGCVSRVKQPNGFPKKVVSEAGLEYLKTTPYSLTKNQEKSLRAAAVHRLGEVYGKQHDLMTLVALGYIKPPEKATALSYNITEKGREWVAAHPTGGSDGNA